MISFIIVQSIFKNCVLFQKFLKNLVPHTVSIAHDNIQTLDSKTLENV